LGCVCSLISRTPVTLMRFDFHMGFKALALHDKVQELRQQRIASGQPAVPASLQGVSKDKIAEVLTQVSLGENTDVRDGVFALLDDETPSWFAKTRKGARISCGATTAHLDHCTEYCDITWHNSSILNGQDRFMDRFSKMNIY